MAGKFEEGVCRCRTAKAKKTYVECSKYSEVGNDYSWWHASIAGFFKLPAVYLKECDFKCSVCIIKCGFKRGLELANSELVTGSSSDINDKRI